MPERAVVQHPDRGTCRHCRMAPGLQRGQTPQQLQADAAGKIRRAAPNNDSHRRDINTTTHAVTFNPGLRYQMLGTAIGGRSTGIDIVLLPQRHSHSDLLKALAQKPTVLAIGPESAAVLAEFVDDDAHWLSLPRLARTEDLPTIENLLHKS